jgi:signal peptidase I
VHRKQRSKVIASFRIVGGVAATIAVLIAVLVGIVAPIAHVGFSTVLSGSMVPAFAPGDLLVTRQIAASSLRVGEVAVLIPAGESVARAHRVVAISRTSPITASTQGDANAEPDTEKFVLTDPEVRIVQASIPGAGFMLQLTQNPLVRSGLIILVGLLITASVLRVILRPRIVFAQ